MAPRRERPSLSDEAGSLSVTETLIAAMHDERWSEALSDLADDLRLNEKERALVERAQQATSDIDRAAVEARQRLAGELRLMGLKVIEDGEPPGIEGRAVLWIASGQLSSAVSRLEELGFLTQHSLSPGALKAWSHVGSHLNMLPDHREGFTRVTLKWRIRSSRSRLRRLFDPAIPDLQVASLPEWMAWAYWFLRPLRVLRDRLNGRMKSVNSPYLSTPLAMVGPLLEPLNPTSRDRIIDLGCGDGRVLIEAARLFGCRGVGVDFDRRLVDVARRAVAESGVDELVEIVQGDLLDRDLDDFSIVFLFLPGSHVAQILPDVLERLMPGARLLAHEQSPVDWPIAPDDTYLVMGPAGVTAAHVWSIETCG